MKISQLPIVSTLDGTEYVLLVVGNTNNRISVQDIVNALEQNFNNATTSYVDAELGRLLVDDSTRIVPTKQELQVGLDKKSDLEHNHDTAYATKTHTHSYSEIMGTPEIPAISLEEINQIKNDIVNLGNTVTANDSEYEAVITALIARIEALENADTGGAV